MERSVFDRFKNEVILTYCAELKREDTQGALRFNEKAIDKVYIFYQKKRDLLRKNYMAKGTEALDRHKVASCFIYAILKAKIIKVNRLIPDLPQKILMANQYLAFYVAMNIIDMYKRDEDIKYKDFKLVAPKTYHEDLRPNINCFIHNTCIGLYHIKDINNFDIFAYATIMFQMEKYTDTVSGY